MQHEIIDLWQTSPSHRIYLATKLILCIDISMLQVLLYPPACKMCEKVLFLQNELQLSSTILSSNSVNFWPIIMTGFNKPGFHTHPIIQT